MSGATAGPTPSSGARLPFLPAAVRHVLAHPGAFFLGALRAFHAAQRAVPTRKVCERLIPEIFSRSTRRNILVTHHNCIAGNYGFRVADRGGIRAVHTRCERPSLWRV